MTRGGDDEPVVLFRCDASAGGGFGHLTRSAYVASLIKPFAPVLFLTRPDTAAQKYLQEKRLPHRPFQDRQARLETPTRLIVFDLRRFGDGDLALLIQARESGIPTIQITDLGLERQEVDCVLDSSWQPIHPYPTDQPGLLGPAYALLHHKFRHFWKAARKYKRRNHRLFISLGGGVEYRALRDLIDPLHRHGYVLKIAPGFVMRKAHRKSLQRVFPGLRLVGRTESLARSFFEADTAIIAAGTAAFEAAACGTPALYLYHDSFQERHADAFAAAGCGVKIGPLADPPLPEILAALLAFDRENRHNMGMNGKKTVDGDGARRFVAFLQEKGWIRAHAHH